MGGWDISAVQHAQQIISGYFASISATALLNKRVTLHWAAYRQTVSTLS